MATAVYGTGIYGTDTYGEATQGPGADLAIALIREGPPIRMHVVVTTPGGRKYRWGDDEPRPENIPTGLRFSDTMPGGFESMDVTLARKVGSDYADLERLSTIQVLGASGDIAGEYRLERVPRTSGNQMAISPSAVGWSAHLEDDKSAKEIYVDQNLSNWQGPSAQRKINLDGSYRMIDPSTAPDRTTNSKAFLTTAVSGNWIVTAKPAAEAWYNANGIPIGHLDFSWKKNANIDAADANWHWDARLEIDDVTFSGGDGGSNLRAVGPGIAGTVAATASNRVFAVLRLVHGAANAGADNVEYDLYWTMVAVYGNHGIPVGGVATATEAQGLLASSIVQHAVNRWAPRLRTPVGSIEGSGFLVPHLAFLEPTTAGEIVRQATRFGLQDWAVWENMIFYWHSRGARGRKWRARIAPSQLEETGPQVERVWNGIIVQFQDVDGSTKTIGPEGSYSTVTSGALLDYDPENPANKAGIRRWDILQTGVSTAAAAEQIGLRFLEESRRLDSSGRARFVGTVEDDRGVKHPYWRVRAGDAVSFIDAADSSYRRIVKTEKTVSDRTCSIDIDAPPEGLQALLERLGAILIPIGV